MYSCHLFLISPASVRSVPFLSFIEPIFAWNIPLVSLIYPFLLQMMLVETFSRYFCHIREYTRMLFLLLPSLKLYSFFANLGLAFSAKPSITSLLMQCLPLWPPHMSSQHHTDVWHLCVSVILSKAVLSKLVWLCIFMNHFFLTLLQNIYIFVNYKCVPALPV